ncbi:outer membrane protein transport protein [Mesorhizobium sp. VNQ89]|uniref:outer membrane protein transport protein n=1 Tax=Mesorhizobium quangtriensis TaxID=3157709 RepID=UPI0032B85898
MKRLRIKALLVGFSSLAVIGQAGAGGFNRGVANLDGLYGAAQLGFYGGVTYVSPQRSYETIEGTNVGFFPSTNPPGQSGPVYITDFTQTDVTFSNDYVVPYASVGGRIVGDVNCVGSYVQPFGADSEYYGPITFQTASQKLETNEYGLTCGYGFDLSKGRLSLIGGTFYETVDYSQARNFTGYIPGVSGDSTVALDSGAWGYRLGVGYEIPEYALKAQLLYRSQTNHDASGEYSNTPFYYLAALNGAGNLNPYNPSQLSAPASATASLPAMLDLTVQSGIAEGWLAFGSVKWTDWSVLSSIIVTEGLANQPFSTTRFFFEDGWTVTGGVGHRFNESLAGSFSITWDKGVTTGWDTLTDTWTFAGGVAYDVKENIQVRAGGAAIYFTEGQKWQTASPIDYVASSPAEWGYALSISAAAKF